MQDDMTTLASLAGTIAAKAVEVSGLTAAKGLPEPGYGKKRHDMSSPVLRRNLHGWLKDQKTIFFSWHGRYV